VESDVEVDEPNSAAMVAWNQMALRSSRLLIFLLVVALIIVGIVIAYKTEMSKGSTSFPATAEPTPAMRTEPGREQENKSDGRDRYGERPEQGASCMALGVACSSNYFTEWREPSGGTCKPSIRNGYPVPDARCTPGGFNTTVTAPTLREPGWKTRCIRNCASTESEKHVVYRWYGIAPHHGNSGKNQVCELDHLVPLELGGADGLGNIWPECGPDAAVLKNRFFKTKDRVENYLAREVRAGRMSLGDAQRGIATDWTQYLPAANRY
jgi:hypothetical protein